MYSIENIIAMQDEQSVKASKQKLQPIVANADKDDGVFKCPKLGHYRPKGWKEVNTFFVDNSGFGSEGESAITAEQFLSKVRKGYGYAITEEGQFQIYITEFERV